MSLALAARYAAALVDVVVGTKGALAPDTVIGQLRQLEALVGSSPELRTVLESPAVPVDRKLKLIGRVCDSLAMHRLVRNFVYVVVKKRRGGLFPHILAAFEKLMDERMGVQPAAIRSALPMSESSRLRLEAELTRLTGKRIRPRYSEDPSLIGGVVAKIGSLVYDGSVRGQLEAIEKQLKFGA